VEAIVFVGIPASGKSTFFRERLFDTHVRINLDMLRTRNRERILVNACVAAKQPFAVDNTNVRCADRAEYIRCARAADFRVIAYYFQTDLRAAIWHNNQRTGKQKIAIPGLISKWKRLEAPALAEGFDELFAVTITDERKFIVSPWVNVPADLAGEPK
jgi:predicted kinase